MNITVNSQSLVTELRLLNKIVPSKPTIAILSHVLMSADRGLTLHATDLEVGLITPCAATVHETGIVALPAVKLLALVEQFPNADVSIVLEKGKAVVRCGAFTTRLQVVPVDEFPALTPVQGTMNVLPSDGLRRLIAKTRYAITEMGSKYILKGGLMTLAGQAAALAATDSKRLALVTIGRTGSDASAVIPAKTLDAIVALLGDGDVEMTVGPQHLFFRFGARLLISRTIDGKFPAYERIIPKQNVNRVTVDKNGLAAALRRITLVSDENQAVYFTVANDALMLSTSSAEVGSADEKVACDYAGPTLKVCMNGSYVLDFLDVAGDERIIIALKDATGAVLLLDGQDHLAVVMAMKA